MGKVRIIGGKWRSRQINFPSVDGLRPTQDRVRETLFNWLAMDIQGAVCLDLFAGTGALGFEALSRGAAKTIFIESQAELLEAMHQNSALLKAQNADIVQGICPTNMPQFYQSLFDVVFIDPPFYKNLVHIAIEWLEQSKVLRDNALIYIECEKNLSLLSIPSHWRMIKSSKTSAVQFFLYQVSIEQNLVKDELIY